MKFRYLVSGFLEGACVMAAEILSARLIAPLYGSSLYIWSAILAMTLGGLAIGYFAGGYFSLKPGTEKRLAYLLLLATLSLLLMPFISVYILPRLSYLSLWAGILSGAFLLVVPPLFFLGATSPMFIKLQTNASENAGRVGGTVYAISTSGGILSSFLCGFYFIPEWGLHNTAFLFAGLLVLSVLLVSGNRTILIIIGFLLLLGVWMWNALNKPQTIVYSSNSVLGECQVTQQLNSDGDTIRRLLINQIVQTELNVSDSSIITDYLNQLDTLVPPKKGGKALVLGLGGGLSVGVLMKKGYNVEAVEFDERIIYCAERWFGLSEKALTYHDDARRYLNRTEERYDVILADVFKAEEQPSHVLTVESLNRIKHQQLKSGGQLWINWHGYLAGANGKGTRILLNTLSAAGFKTRIYTTLQPEAYRNLLMCASPEAGKKTMPLFETEQMNTDDQPCLELANARANKNWREHYLRYYQGRGTP